MIEVKLSAIKEFIFPKDDVVKEKRKLDLRKYNLRRAMALGNLYKRRVKVYFRTVDGYLKRVDATVWAVGDEFVSFRSGISIPIRSVEQVEF